YLVGLKAHFSYWNNRAMMRFLVRCLAAGRIVPAAAHIPDGTSATTATTADDNDDAAKVALPASSPPMSSPPSLGVAVAAS
ncbi:hypothetical protein HK405_001547, partial [Cladochytrium tenue]